MQVHHVGLHRTEWDFVRFLTRQHLRPFAFVVVHMVYCNDSAANFGAVQVVDSQVGAALVLVRQERKALRLACILMPACK